MGIGEPTLLDPSILASTLDDLNGLYTIGTYASRLNVASQQRRAINLIEAIDREFRISGKGTLARKRVLIVGAGAAGVAAAIAARLYDASISLVDKAAEPFSLLNDAAHRILSPKQNNWPFENIGHTTYLPFCNWFEANGKTVEDCLKADWDIYAKNIGVEFDPHVEVTELNEVLGGNKWKVSFKVSPKNSSLNEPFDIVIFATGYGPEIGCGTGNFPSYWSKEQHNNHLKVLTGLRHDKAMVIKGNGDGGLIEATSQAYTDIDPGGYSVDFLATISQPRIMEAFRSIEHSIRTKLTAYQLQQFKFSSKSQKKTNADYRDFLDKVDQELWLGYKRIIEPMLDKKDNYLHQLELGNTNKFEEFYVVGRNRYPFSINSSPINRILYTTALLTKTVTYISDPNGSSVNVKGNALEITDAEVFNPASDKMRTHRLSKKVGCAVELRRFGSVSPLVHIKVNGTVLKKREPEIRVRQKLYADHDSISPQLAFGLWQKLQTHRFKFEEHPTYLENRANAFCQEFFKEEDEPPKITCTICEEHAGRCDIMNQSFDYNFQLQYNPKLKSAGGSYLASLMKFPDKLFGVPVEQTSDAVKDLVS
jgi:hypothetical protein